MSLLDHYIDTLTSTDPEDPYLQCAVAGLYILAGSDSLPAERITHEVVSSLVRYAAGGHLRCEQYPKQAWQLLMILHGRCSCAQRHAAFDGSELAQLVQLLGVDCHQTRRMVASLLRAWLPCCPKGKELNYDLIKQIATQLRDATFTSENANVAALELLRDILPARHPLPHDVCVPIFEAITAVALRFDTEACNGEESVAVMYRVNSNIDVDDVIERCQALFEAGGWRVCGALRFLKVFAGSDNLAFDLAQEFLPILTRLCASGRPEVRRLTLDVVRDLLDDEDVSDVVVEEVPLLAAMLRLLIDDSHKDVQWAALQAALELFNMSRARDGIRRHQIPTLLGTGILPHLIVVARVYADQLSLIQWSMYEIDEMITDLLTECPIYRRHLQAYLPNGDENDEAEPGLPPTTYIVRDEDARDLPMEE